MFAPPDNIIFHAGPPESPMGTGIGAFYTQVTAGLVSMQKAKIWSLTFLGVTRRGAEDLELVSGLRYKMPSMTVSCSNTDQKVRVTAASIRTSLQGGFLPTSTQVSTFDMISSSACQARNSSADHGSHQSFVPPEESKSKEQIWWPGQPGSTELSLLSCLSQKRQSAHGLRDKPSAFLCAVPGLCSISKLYWLRTCNHRQTCPSGFLNRINHLKEPWSVRIMKCRPYK